MPVGLLTLELHIPDAQSLKDKRQVLRSLKDKLRRDFNVAVAELEHHDTWQRSVVGIVTISNEEKHLREVLQKVLGEEIAHEVNAMLAGELKDPRLEVSVVASEVRVQPDMKHARVFINVKGTNKEQNDAIKALEHASGYIRRELVERLQLRRVPELHFILDLSQEHVERIERLLKEMKKDNPPAAH